MRHYLYYIGIDPGLDGATVLIDPMLHMVKYVAHSTVGRSGSYLSPIGYDRALDMLLAGEIKHNTYPVAFIESAMILGSQRSAVTIGVNWGIVWASIVRLGIECLGIHPMTWKSNMIPVSVRKGSGKQSSCIIATEMGYTVPLHAKKGKVLHDGVADAILIAEYGAQAVRSQ